jgi:hypothetical protein
MLITNYAEFFAALKELTDAWCGRRALKPLAHLLPAYTAFNGMTDGWGDLLGALKNVRAFCRDDVEGPESVIVADLIRAAERAVFSRNSN